MEFYYDDAWINLYAIISYEINRFINLNYQKFFFKIIIMVSVYFNLIENPPCNKIFLYLQVFAL